MKIYAITKKGEHSENEDRILINDTILSDGIFETECNGELKICIADGVGGNNAGATASSFVCENLKNIALIGKNDLIDINSKLLAKSTENVNYNGMATTLSGICIDDEKSSIFHIGNTRIYIFQSSYIKQITEDHTSVNWLVKAGKLSKKDAEFYDRRNEITACFGGDNPTLINSLKFDENHEMLSNAKRIVLTSDGVHEYVSVDELEDILNTANIYPLQACKKIINLAKTNGSNDDKSIAIIDRWGDFNGIKI